MRTKLVRTLGIIMLSLTVGVGQTLQTQTNVLATGWNLIAFQVLPADRTPAAVFGTLGTDFVAVWTFDNQTRQWSRYARPGTLDATNNAIAPLGPIDLGRAYWVYMDGPRNLVTIGPASTTTPTVVLTNG